MIFGFRDARYNSWRWRPLLEKWGYLRVLIDPSILRTAIFLVVNDQPISTVFFVAAGGFTYYAVTTRHSIRHPVVSIRFNLKDGGTEDQAFLAGDWIPHASTDIAVLSLEFSLERYDIEFVGTGRFVHRRTLPVRLPPAEPGGMPELLPPYGTGDEIFTVGLFEGHTGQHLAQPVARFGHIALKPAEGEKILADIDPPDLTPIDAFLVEMAVWNGQSGSPVFLRVKTDSWISRGIAYCLIGMLQGFYPSEQDVLINNKPATLSPLHMGIGIVVPAFDISEMFMSNPRLIEQRDKLIKKRKQKLKIRPSAASIKKEASITKESFEDVLKRVSRNTSEPES